MSNVPTSVWILSALLSIVKEIIQGTLRWRQYIGAVEARREQAGELLEAMGQARDLLAETGDVPWEDAAIMQAGLRLGPSSVRKLQDDCEKFDSAISVFREMSTHDAWESADQVCSLLTFVTFIRQADMASAVGPAQLWEGVFQVSLAQIEEALQGLQAGDDEGVRAALQVAEDVFCRMTILSWELRAEQELDDEDE